jgi:hypothetical protein
VASAPPVRSRIPPPLGLLPALFLSPMYVLLIVPPVPVPVQVRVRVRVRAVHVFPPPAT